MRERRTCSATRTGVGTVKLYEDAICDGLHVMVQRFAGSTMMTAACVNDRSVIGTNGLRLVPVAALSTSLHNIFDNVKDLTQTTTRE